MPEIGKDEGILGNACHVSIAEMRAIKEEAFAVRAVGRSTLAPLHGEPSKRNRLCHECKGDSDGGSRARPCRCWASLARTGRGTSTPMRATLGRGLCCLKYRTERSASSPMSASCWRGGEGKVILHGSEEAVGCGTSAEAFQMLSLWREDYSKDGLQCSELAAPE